MGEETRKGEKEGGMEGREGNKVEWKIAFHRTNPEGDQIEHQKIKKYIHSKAIFCKTRDQRGNTRTQWKLDKLWR